MKNEGSMKEKVKTWLKDPYNLAIIGVLIASFLIRLYYLIYTKGQTLWWDEAEYMSSAKNIAFGVPYDFNPQRPPLFQLFGAILLKLGLQEFSLKLILVAIPSTFMVFSIYYLGKELFNKKVGLIASIASGFMWSFLFWTTRFQPDFFSMSFQIMAIAFFWKLIKTNTHKYAIYSGLFSALGFYFKISALLVPLSFFVFLVFREGYKIVFEKKYWIYLVSFVLTMLPFLIWQFYSFGNPTAFAPSYIGGTGIGQGWEFGWMTLSFYNIFSKTVFFYLFLFGLFLVVFRLLLSFDIILKDKGKRTDSEIFSLIFLFVVTLFYIFYIRGTIEDRWVFILVPFIFFFCANALLWITEKVTKNDFLKLSVVILIVGVFFIYPHLTHTKYLIDEKKNSYLPVKEASLWIKENSNINDEVLSISYTQATAYSERKIFSYSFKNMSELDDLILKESPRYIMVSVFENHPQWTNQWVSDNVNRLNPVRAYFADEANTQPILIVYEINYKIL